MSRLIRIIVVCLVDLFLFQYLKYEQTRSLSEFSCLSGYIRLYPSANIAGVNCCHSNIAEGESSEPILNRFLQEPCNLIP